MKKLLLLTLLVSASFTWSFGQEEYVEYGFTTLIDEGFAGLKIDATLEDLQDILIKSNREEMWWNPTEDNSITSYYVVDMKKAEIKDFLGYEIERIEVYMDGSLDQHGNPVEEDVYMIAVLLKPYEAGEYGATAVDAAMKKYGRFSDFTGTTPTGITFFQWYSDITLLGVPHNSDLFTGGDTPVSPIIFTQGYGG